MKLNKTKYIGIDIGGAHLKCIGIDKNKNITYTKYFSYEMWVDKNSLKEKLHIINNDMKDIDACVGITMSAELCDSFKSRRIGGQFIVKACEILNFKKFFYSNHLEAFRPKIVLDEIMSMNWHSIGRLCEKKIKNCLIIDFGSTTTDFLCIKNFKFQNKYFDDFSRLNNNELIYSGLIRTPLFGLKKM